MSTVLKVEKWPLSQQQTRQYPVIQIQRKRRYPFSVTADFPMTKKNMSCVGNVLAGIIQVVHKYRSGQSTRKESGNAKDAKIAEL